MDIKTFFLIALAAWIGFTISKLLYSLVSHFNLLIKDAKEYRSRRIATNAYPIYSNDRQTYHDILFKTRLTNLENRINRIYSDLDNVNTSIEEIECRIDDINKED